MKDFGFKVKVSDLLQNPGSQDQIEFEKKFTNQIEGLTEEGISGKVFLFGSSPKSIDLVIQKLKLKVNEKCEICGKDYTRDILVTDYETTFVTPDIHHDITEKIHDEEFIINTKDMTIDIEDVIAQAANLTNPIVKKCENCTKNVETDDFSTEEEIEESQWWKINIVFVNKK